MQEEKTNVMRLLDQKKIPYLPHWYASPDGAVDGAVTAQAVSLAVRSLALTGRDFAVELGHMGFVTGLFDAVGAPEAVRPRLLTCVRDRNIHELQKAAEAAGLSRQGTEALCRLPALAG